MGKPSSIDGAIWRKVIDAFHIAESIPFCFGVVVVHVCILQIAALTEQLAIQPAESAGPVNAWLIFMGVGGGWHVV